MANKAFGFSVGVRTALDENENGEAIALGTFVVLDDDNHTVSQWGSDIATLEVLLSHDDTPATLRTKLAGAVQSYYENPQLEITWMDES